MNIPFLVRSQMHRKLHLQKCHPVELIKSQLYSILPDFEKYYFDPVVSIEDNFDRLLIPKDHPSRSVSDTYYLNDNQVLRTHTSAHQCDLLSKGVKKFVVTGDVYRRDEVDRFHYPIFHQMEGVCICDDPKDNLLNTVKAIVNRLFGNTEFRLVDSYFPFTNPSWELEILWQDRWIEVAGMGLVRSEILESCNVQGSGWAFGIGLERLAMILFEIPDIRLFWTDDERFINQFSNGPTKFTPYSCYPICYKDIAFWINKDKSYSHNDFYEIVRDVGVDLIESVALIDEFHKPDKGTSYCYRISYRSMCRTLENEEINMIQQKIRVKATKQLNIELR